MSSCPWARRRDSKEPYKLFSTALSSAWMLSYLPTEIAHFVKWLLMINLEII